MILRFAFFGTPVLAADFLNKIVTELNDTVEVIFVATAADKPIGRTQILTPSPVKQIATKHNIDFFDGLLKDMDNEKGKLLQQCDIAIVYYYGQIISDKLLAATRHGFINIHFSKLPKYRGATPATFSLIMGDTATAVSFVQTDAKLDHGPLVAKKEVVIDPTESRLHLEEKLHTVAWEMFYELVKDGIENIKATEQDHTKATYTLLPTKQHGFVPLSILRKAFSNEPLKEDEIPSLIRHYLEKNQRNLHSQEILRFAQNDKSEFSASQVVYNYFRGLSPWPGIWTIVYINGKDLRLKITDLTFQPQTSNLQLHVNKVQLEGKNEVDFAQFQKSYAIL